MIVVKILTQPKYAVLAITVTLVIIVFAAWLPNLHLVAKTTTNSTMSLWQKINLLTGLLGSLRTNFTPLSRLITFVSAALAGIQTSLLMYYLKQTFRAQQSMGMSIVGIAASMVGVGCVSCGSVILTSLIGFGSTTAVLGLLPFRGLEFGIIGAMVLLLAISLTIKKIKQPLVC